MSSVALVLFPAGAVLGSFLSVVSARLPRKQDFVHGRSQCPSCDAEIAARDNIPIVSWLLLRGRCRNCHQPISVRYPLIEASLGLLWVACYFVIGTDDVASLALGMALCALLVTVTVTDLELRVIPNAVLAVGAVLAVALLALGDAGELPSHLVAAVAAGGGLLIVALAYPAGMGMGDVKLAAVLGLYLGRAVAPALLIAFAAGALVGVALMARHGSEARKRTIPFGPFLALGGLAGLFAGNELVDAYLDTFAGG
jgi:leader peptidase (prepilin peptidase)/N-methyltransferase